MGQVILSVIIALIVGIVVYITKLQKGQAFNGKKLGRTALVGLIIGILVALTDLELKIPAVLLLSLATAGAINFADQIVKFVTNLKLTIGIKK